MLPAVFVCLLKGTLSYGSVNPLLMHLNSVKFRVEGSLTAPKSFCSPKSEAAPFLP